MDKTEAKVLKNTLKASLVRNRNNFTECLNYPKDICRAIYTMNAIESLNFSFRKVTGNKPSFPADDSVYKIMYLAIKNNPVKFTV